MTAASSTTPGFPPAIGRRPNDCGAYFLYREWWEAGRRAGRPAWSGAGTAPPVPGKGERAEEWTAAAFRRAEALIFVGAAGIAVRSVAPHLVSKARDPAVVVVDELGRFAVPILSGHLGGANDLAREIAGLLGGQAVLTTATDARGIFAFDQWARRLAAPSPTRRRSAPWPPGCWRGGQRPSGPSGRWQGSAPREWSRRGRRRPRSSSPSGTRRSPP